MNSPIKSPVRVLVVDDSASMRSLISHALERDGEIEVVGRASNALEAREAIKALNPDVMTLDVEMPHMDGLDFLDKVMRLRPFPVVMVSSLTASGAGVAIRAMEIGAVDCVGKPSIAQAGSFEDLAQKVKAAARARLERRTPGKPPSSTPAQATYESDGKLVAIGASTGGVEALVEVISRMPAQCPPTLIVVHMPSPFTKSFAKRLDGMTPANVAEAEDGAPIRVGQIYVARGGTHLEARGRDTLRCAVAAGDTVSGHCPSVDVLFNSVARTCGKNSVGVILTGMGRDGANGLLALRRTGARTIGQDEATSLVYGMPKAAFECGAVEAQAPLHDITKRVLALTSAQGTGS